jgi:molybdenum cofactor cytidylyltransferase
MTIPRIIGIYLAAGSSRRMGTDKRKLPFANKTLGTISLQNALSSHLSHVLVITKRNDPLDWIASELLENKKLEIAFCPLSTYGQAYSLRCGVERAIHLQADAIVVLLADQPFVTANDVNTLIHQYIGYQPDYAAFINKSVPMPPILFAKTTFSDLLCLQGDEGARRLIRSRKQWNGIALEPSHHDLFFDIDTPRNYELAFKRWSNKE